MRSLPHWHWFGATILAMFLPVPTFAQTAFHAEFRLTGSPSDIILCPGEEATITITTEKELLINRKNIWVRAGAVEVQLATHQVQPDGETLTSTGTVKSDAKTGMFMMTTKAAAKAGTVEYFNFVWVSYFYCFPRFVVRSSMRATLYASDGNRVVLSRSVPATACCDDNSLPDR